MMILHIWDNKKGIRRPLSNFNFEFKGKIIASTSCSTGFTARVLQEHDESDSDVEESLTRRYTYYQCCGIYNTVMLQLSIPSMMLCEFVWCKYHCYVFTWCCLQVCQCVSVTYSNHQPVTVVT